MRRWTLAMVVLVGIGGASARAQAASVDCSNEYGECTVSNDDGDFASCGCGDTSGTGGTGGNDWDGLTEDELLEICLAELRFCGAGGSDTEGTSATTIDPSATDSDPSATDTSTTSDSDPSASASDTSTATDTDPSASDTSTASDSDPSASASDTSSATDTASDTGGSDDTGGESDEAGSEDEASASAEDASASAEDASATDPGDGESSGGGQADDDDDDKGGCSVDPSGRDRAGLLGLGVLGLAGLRRRRR